MRPTACDFYDLFCNNKFKKITESIQDGFSGMYFVLRILAENTQLIAGDISEMFGVSTARTAVIITTLEKKGYVVKSKSVNDARKTVVSITEKGRLVLNGRINKIFNTVNEFLSKLSDEEVNKFYIILKKLLNCELYS